MTRARDEVYCKRDEVYCKLTSNLLENVNRDVLGVHVQWHLILAIFVCVQRSELLTAH